MTHHIQHPKMFGMFRAHGARMVRQWPKPVTIIDILTGWLSRNRPGNRLTRASWHPVSPSQLPMANKGYLCRRMADAGRKPSVSMVGDKQGAQALTSSFDTWELSLHACAANKSAATGNTRSFQRMTRRSRISRLEGRGVSLTGPVGARFAPPPPTLTGVCISFGNSGVKREVI